MSTSRRKFLKAATAGGALAVFGAGFSETAVKLVKGTAGEPPAHALHGNSHAPEFSVDPATGALSVNPAQTVAYTMCMGCTTFCGVRVRVDNATGQVIRVAGNPYSPLSSDPFLPYETPVRESFVALSRHNEQGLQYRSTACGRGNAVLAQIDSPFRITTPLKRIGPRNGGAWEPISFAQLVKEVTEGGDLFGEGHVEGLAALRDLATPIDPERPELGAKVNQVGLIASTDEGRQAFVQRFLQKAYGSINFVGHGSYCGGAYRSGSGAMFNDMKKMPHAKPDFAHAEFVIFMGTAPGNAGNPFKRQGTLLAKARTEGVLNYVVVDPVLTNADNAAVGERGRWIPIRPGTDGALAMAMIRWIIEHERYDAQFLTQPNQQVAEAAGEASWCNATHLVVTQPGHPRNGRFLRGSDLGLQLAEEDKYGEKDPFVVMDQAGGKPVVHNEAAGPAVLFHTGEVATPAGPVAVQSSMALLREEAFKLGLEEYSQACGIPADTIAALAREFTGHGKRAAANAHGGMMAGNGFYNAYAVVMLNTLIGNLNRKGGTLVNGGRFPDAGDGPRYQLETFAGMVKPAGTPLGRNVPYEKSGEFKRKQAESKPYPAQAPWFPNAPGLATEWMTAMFNGYPYGLKALILWNANPVYGIPGVRKQVADQLADPKKLPLIVAIDPFINETVAYADYIVPDSVAYESWGWAAPWAGVPTKATTARRPVIEPRMDKLPDGQPIGMESFFIAVAKRLALPGFGANAIADMEGNTYPLDTPEDFYLRGGANVAFAGKPVPDAGDEDMQLSGVARIAPLLQQTLKEDEWRKAAYVYARGGRYQNQSETYKDDWAANRFTKPLQLYNENLGTAKSSVTGKRFVGTPTWTPPAFADGTPVEKLHSPEDWPLWLVSFKSPLQNSYSIAAARLRRIHPENPVILHTADAARLGIRTGDRIRITTPGGGGMGVAVVREGVMRGVAAIEHGFGHRELGARPHRIGTHKQPDIPEIAGGVNLNDMGIPDPTRKGASVFVDPVAGTSVRQGLPARIKRV